MKKTTGTAAIALALNLIVFMLLTASTFAKAEGGLSLDDLLIKVEEAKSVLTSIKANITITRAIPLLESEEVSKGKLTYQKPRKIYIKYDPPKNEINIIDEKHLLIYHLDQKQIEKYELANVGAQMNMFFDFGLDDSLEDIKRKYNIALINYSKAGGRGLYKLELSAKGGEVISNFSKIQFYVHEGLWLPVIFELWESGGEILNRVELNKVSVNKSVSGKLFKLKIPKDVEVIEPLK